MKIFVIDDNAAVITTLKLVLTPEFGSVTPIGDPKMFPAILAGGDIDAVLLDMNFTTGSMDGSEGLFWLSIIKETPSAPAVIMITAFGDMPLAIEAMKRGAEDFVTKPWDNDDLIAKIRVAVKKNREAKESSRRLEEAKTLRLREQQMRDMTLEEMKIQHIRNIIAQCDGNLSMAAERLGINRQTLYNTLKKADHNGKV